MLSLLPLSRWLNTAAKHSSALLTMLFLAFTHWYLISILIAFCTIDLALSALISATSNLPSGLSSLAILATASPDRSEFLGGQNFVQCCQRAIRDSYDWAPNGSITLTEDTSQRWVKWTLDEINAPEFQLPCDASYQGDGRPADYVNVSYSRCNSDCPGWQLSKSQVFNQWIQPFVGFILPAAFFCLNVGQKAFKTLRC